jgi:hypothetical protein
LTTGALALALGLPESAAWADITITELANENDRSSALDQRFSKAVDAVTDAAQIGAISDHDADDLQRSVTAIWLGRRITDLASDWSHLDAPSRGVR